MTNRWLIGAATAALTAAGAFATQAADLPSKKMAPAPIFVPPPFTWTGFYVGVNAGGIWGQGSVSTQTFAPGLFGPILVNDFPGGHFGGGQTGFIGGGQAGYNWQTGSFVLGVETDFDWTSLSRNSSFIGPTFVDPFGFNDSFTENGSRKLDWLGTTRARVGFVATPDNRLMFYGTGGLAYGGASNHLNIFDVNNGWYWNGNGNNNTRTGWTIGAGAEYAITNNITLKGEYLYYDLGSSHQVTVPNPAASVFFPGSYTTAKINFDGSVFRVGVNYKF
jgi:outer membrane immunogenic protein